MARWRLNPNPAWLCLCGWLLSSVVGANTVLPRPAEVAGDPLARYWALPPGERYWQLSFLMAVTEGLDDDAVERLAQERGSHPGPVDPDALAAYTGAGLRIADAGRIVGGLAELARYRIEAGPQILAELAAIEERWPTLIAMLDRESLAEEALLVRFAMLDGLEAVLGGPGSETVIAAYRDQTLAARNQWEYRVFERQVDAVTDAAIEQTEGRLDAFHRMVDEEYDLAFLRERVLSAERMNDQVAEEHRRYALQRTFRTLIILAPIINRYFYYD